MKPRFVVSQVKGTENGKWNGRFAYEVRDTEGLNAPALILSHDSKESAQCHCDRLNGEETGKEG